MDPITIAALIAGGTGILSSIGNWISGRKTNNQNLDYAKATTQKQWERDDTSYQRSVADAQAAGFSPLAVLDGGLIGNSSAVGYQGQAPQFDINGVLNAVMSAGSQLSTYAENQRASQREIMKIKTEYNNALDLAQKELENQKELITWEQDESFRILQEINKEEVSKQKQLTQIEKLKELGVVSTREYPDEKQASLMYTSWCDTFSDYVESYKQYTTTNTETDTEKAGTNIPIVNAAVETGSTSTNTESQSLSFAEYMESFFLENPMPLNPDGTIPNFIRSKSTRKTY